MSAGSVLLDAIARESGQISDSTEGHNVLSFELEFKAAPELDTERRRIAAGLGVDAFDLFAIHKDLPRFLVLRFLKVRRSISRRGMFAIANEIANRLELRSCVPEGATSIPTDNFEDPRSAEGQIGEEVLNHTCWSSVDDNLQPDWIVESIGLQEAWLQTKGAGVMVAQPDTGIADHTELDGNINHHLAFNVFTGEAGDAIDPLSPDMGNPGHGTATGSVITSTGAGRVLGIAPEAELIPIRCIDSVIFGLDGSNIAAAILYARDVGAHVISMSLGGAFVSNSIREALALAVDDGMIVVCAAGNCVGIVVYPAFDDNSIAIAGVGVGDAKWKGSSSGRDVDVSAPSENVFAARRDAEDGGAQDVRPSQGTSFGTALTAGVAALWLSKHGPDVVRTEAARRGVTVNQLFRIAVRKSAREPDDWDASLGTGVVNAAELLALPLSDIVEEEDAQPESPLFSAHRQIAELARNAETVDGFDWARYGPEAVYLSAETLARKDPRLSALTESSTHPVPTEDLARQAVPDILKQFVRRPDGAPLISRASSPPAEPKADSLHDFRRRSRQGGLEGNTPPISDLLAKKINRIRSLNPGGLESFAMSTERAIERLNSDDMARAAVRGGVHRAGLEAIEHIRQGAAPDELTLEARVGFEALVRLTDRPALRLEGDAISQNDPMFEDGGWGPLLIGSPQVPIVSRAVGRINLEGQHVGTGFVVASDLIMTNRHVLEGIAEEIVTSRGRTWTFPFGKAEIDFSFAGLGGAAFDIIEVVFASATPTFGKVNFKTLDLVLLRVRTGGGFPEHQLEIAREPSTMQETDKVYVVGYPAQPGNSAFVDPQTGEFSLAISQRLGQIFDLQFGRKYLSPGEIMTPTGQLAGDPKKWVFSQDATTLNGNSGSLIIPFNSQGQVVGLHFAGSVLTGNFAHEIAKTGVEL